MSELTTHSFGWKPSLPDHADLPAEVEGLTVLGEVDPRDSMPPVYDQGQLGSCTANAIAAAFQYDHILNNDYYGGEMPSRLFLYYMERLREGTITTDSGAFGRDGFKVLRGTGIAPESFWPYDISKFAEKPGEDAYEQARLRKIATYVHPGLGHGITLIDRVEAFKRLLSNKQTIAFGFTVYSSFEDQSQWEDGVMPMPIHGESILGGHEVLLVGYLKDHPECGLCRNSWGSSWNGDGYFLMPWKYLADPTYSSDWRSIYREAGK